MADLHSLSLQLENRFHAAVKADPRSKEKREDIREALERAIRDRCGSVHFRLYVFGSTVTGFQGSRLALVFNRRASGSCISPSQFLREIGDEICRNPLQLSIRGATYPLVNLQCVFGAKIPLLEFRVDGIHCDLSAENTAAAVRNSRFLAALFRHGDPRVERLVWTVKTWAKANRINDASQQTLSSYSLTLMTVFFLQTRQPPIVPPQLFAECVVRAIPSMQTAPTTPMTDPQSPDELDRQLEALESEMTQYLAGFRNEAPASSDPSLGQLFVDFLDFYARFDFAKQAVSVRTGTLIPKKLHFRWKDWCVEEPFTQYNASDAVYDVHKFRCIVDVFKSSHAKILSTGDFASVL